MNKPEIPAGAKTILDTLRRHGYETYVVGGCVRDSLLGLHPKDWDICTAAVPERVEQLLAGHRIVETGLKHGTVTVLAGGTPYEVTTFRVDGTYSDNRRPDSVRFVPELREDLARRDFTVNAMAYSPETGLIDPFGGRDDLQRGLIRCVGNAGERFAEDALRVMRALRFASVYEFSIEDATAHAVHENARRLNHIAAERISTELCKLLGGKGILPILLDYSDVLTVIVPELAPCVGFRENGGLHTVYEHVSHAVAACDGLDESVLLALLLHDVAVPVFDAGHALRGQDMAEGILRRLRLDGKTRRETLELIEYHDADIPASKSAVKRWLNRLGPEGLDRLLAVRLADAAAGPGEDREQRLEHCRRLAELKEEILVAKECFAPNDLALRGSDLIGLGVPEGKHIGDILRLLLDMVIDGEVENERGTLLRQAENMLHPKRE